MKTFVESMRTRYGRLTAPRSESAAKALTDRDKWIVEKFSFLDQHIVRQRPRSIGSAPVSMHLLLLLLAFVAIRTNLIPENSRNSWLKL